MGIHSNVKSANRLTMQQLWYELTDFSLRHNSFARLTNQSPYAVKGEMISWLCNKGVVGYKTISKADMYQLIHPLKPKQKI
jgi:hypothetical protein